MGFYTVIVYLNANLPRLPISDKFPVAASGQLRVINQPST
ncbi:Uncharacterized protein YR821_0558 [Yersinia ruckeri]|uniref:Uncharacterized protein n=1 Tax=Yersinia ruckeri TaxID=29486 RepID=A0A0A8VA02_YERRU|nr:hypothetical protein yruck0001_24820 [Yersinia ruckeri ATCC 29473]QTD75490.1 Uncharacterized protein YR821_0558 [Yersinia ruckeri]CEK26385.1 hypothetical protein CSF007_3030 [Yersinia ruckeri]